MLDIIDYINIILAPVVAIGVPIITKTIVNKRLEVEKRKTEQELAKIRFENEKEIFQWKQKTEYTFGVKSLYNERIDLYRELSIVRVESSLLLLKNSASIDYDRPNYYMDLITVIEKICCKVIGNGILVSSELMDITYQMEAELTRVKKSLNSSYEDIKHAVNPDDVRSIWHFENQEELKLGSQFREKCEPLYTDWKSQLEKDISDIRNVIQSVHNNIVESL